MSGRPARRLTASIQLSSASTRGFGRSVAVEARRDLDDAAAVAPEHLGEREELVGAPRTSRARSARRARGGAASASVDQPSAPAPSAPRRASVVMRSSSSSPGTAPFVEAALAHRVVAERGVPDHAADVHPERRAAEPARGTRRRSPSPTADRRGCSEPGCPRPTPSSRRGRCGRRSCTGAKVTPQLPMTTDVTPCQHDDEPIGSHANCASRCVCTSTKPGVTSRPSASISRAPRSSTAPTSTMRSPSTATSARTRRRARAVDDACRPRITRSCRHGLVNGYGPVGGARYDLTRRQIAADDGSRPGTPGRGAHVGGGPDIPLIVSVDDHVVEPPHVWERWLPERFRDRAPRIERKGIAGMRHVGGGTYELEFDDDAPQADCWVYEGLVLPHKRHVAAVGFDRDDMTLSPITYDEMRPGCYEPKARVDDMLDEPRRGQPLLPDVPAVLRPDLPRGRRSGSRDGVRARLQRLDGGGVVRGQRGRARPADHHPVVGRRRQPSPRSSATPHAACTPSASARSLRISGSRASTAGTGTRSSLRAPRTA